MGEWDARRMIRAMMRQFVYLTIALVLLLSIFYSVLYTAVVSPLAIAFIGLALLWRNADARRWEAGRSVLPGAGGA